MISLHNTASFSKTLNLQETKARFSRMKDALCTLTKQKYHTQAPTWAL